MSHIATIQARLKDRSAVDAACRRLGLAPSIEGSAPINSGYPVAGILVQFPAWHMPIVIEPKTGTVKFDNYGGLWGPIGDLNRFTQAYAIEKARIEARKKGLKTTETTRPDGTIELEITPR